MRSESKKTAAKSKDSRRGILLRLDQRTAKKLNKLVAARATRGATPTYQATLVELIERAAE